MNWRTWRRLSTRCNTRVERRKTQLTLHQCLICKLQKQSKNVRVLVGECTSEVLKSVHLSNWKDSDQSSVVFMVIRSDRFS